MWVQMAGPDDPLERNKDPKVAFVKCLACKARSQVMRNPEPWAPVAANPRTGY
jgi:hypothetical protein